MTLILLTDLAEVWRMDENLTSRANYRISGKLSPVCRVFSIRDRIRAFHTDSTQTGCRNHSLFVTPANP